MTRAALVFVGALLLFLPGCGNESTPSLDGTQWALETVVGGSLSPPWTSTIRVMAAEASVEDTYSSCAVKMVAMPLTFDSAKTAWTFSPVDGLVQCQPHPCTAEFQAATKVTVGQCPTVFTSPVLPPYTVTRTDSDHLEVRTPTLPSLLLTYRRTSLLVE